MICIWCIIIDFLYYLIIEDELKGSGNNMVGYVFVLLYGDCVWC